MANNGGQIRFGVNFDVDQSSLNKIKSALKEISNLSTKDLKIIDEDKAQTALNEIKKSAGELQTALQKSFNADLGTLNISKFNQELHKIDLKKIQSDLAQAGSVGQRAFKDIATQALTTNMQLKQTNNFLNQIGTTMINTVKWGIASSVMNSFTGSIQEAFGYIKALDTSLTNIRIVTGQSSDEMAKFAVQANDAAAALGRQTKEYTQAALTFYQQGLDATAVKERTETVLKASNITGEATAQMAEYLTAVWNGFKTEVGNEVEVVDKLAAVADTSASNMAELATGMSKTASVASSMGVDIDQLSAQLATIIATTRQAPESVGNALKTIYTRIADIKTGADGAETSLGNYSAQMARVGFNVLDANGKFRDMGEIMEEVGFRWKDLTKEQQIYLARVMAGQRQINNITALFDNWDRYVKELNVSLQAEGTLEQKNAVYMESLAAHMKQLEAAKEGLISSFIDSDSFKGVIDGLTTAIKLFDNFIKAIGGGGTALAALGSIGLNVFSKQLAGSIATFVTNIQNAKENINSLAAQTNIVNLLQGLNLPDAQLNQLIEIKKQALDLGTILSEQEHNQINNLIRMTAEIQNQQSAWEDNKNAAEDFFNRLSNANKKEDLVTFDEDILKKGGLSQLTESGLKELQEATRAEGMYLKELRKDMDDFSNSVRNNTVDLRQNKQEGEDDAQVNERRKIALQNLNAEIQNVASSLLKEVGQEKATADAERLSEEQVQRLTKAYKAYQDALASGNRDTIIKQARLFAQETSEITNELENGIKRTLTTLEQAGNHVEDTYKSKLNSFQQRIYEIIDAGKLKANIQGFTKFIGSLTSIASGISMVSNGFKILSDDTATVTEKFNALFSSCLTGFTLMGNGIWNVIKNFSAFKDVIASVLPLLLKFAPVIVIIAAIGAAVYDAYQYFTRFERAVDEANNKLKEQKEILSSLQNDYKELNSAIGELQSHQDTLKNLQKGTKEWADEVQNVNTQVLNLLNKFPELASHISNINGVLQISKSALNDVVDKQAEAIQKQQAITLLAESNVYDKKNDLAYDNAESYVSRAGINNKGIVVSDPETRENLNKVINAVKEHGTQILDNSDKLSEFAHISENVANKVVEHKSEVISLIDETRTNTIAMQNLNTQAIALVNASSNIPEEYRDLVNALEGNILAQNNRNYIGEIENAFSKGDWLAEATGVFLGSSGGALGSTIYQQEKSQVIFESIVNTYLDELGISASTVTKDLNDLSITLQNGQKIRLDEMKQAINYNKAIADAVREQKEHIKVIGQISKETGANSKVMSVAINGLSTGVYNLSGLTREEINQVDNVVKALQNASNKIEGLEFKSENANTTLDKKQEYQDRLDIAKEGSTSAARGALFTALNQGSNKDELQSLQEMYAVIDQGNEKIGNSLAKFVNNIDVNKDKLGDFYNILERDIPLLSSEEGFSQIKSDLQEIGIQLPLIDLVSSDLVEDLGYAGVLTDTWKNKLTDTDNIISKITTDKKLSKTESQALQDSYDSLYGSAQRMEEIFPQIGMAIKEAFDPNLNGTQIQIDAFNQIRESQEALFIGDAAESYKKAIDNFSDLVNKYKKVKEVPVSLELSAEDIDTAQLQEDINAALQNLMEQDVNFHLKLLVDLESDVEQVTALDEMIESLEAMSEKGISSLSKEWENAEAGLLSLADSYYDTFKTSILDTVEITSDGIVQIKEECVQQLQEVAAAQQQALQGEIEAEAANISETLALHATKYRALATAAREYGQALINQAKERVMNEAKGEQAATSAVVDAVNDKKAAYETELANVQTMANQEGTALEQIARDAINSSQDQVAASADAARAAGEAGPSISTSWSNAADSTVKSIASIIAALKALATAQIQVKNEQEVTVTAPTQGGAGASQAGGSVDTTSTASEAGTNSAAKSFVAALKLTDAEVKNLTEDTMKKTQADLEAAGAAFAQADAAEAAAEALENQALSANKATAASREAGKGGGGGKGKGGGGKGKKEKEPKKEKEKEPDKMEPFDDEELDSIQGKFHDIDQEIQKLTQDLEKLAKLQDRYLGSALVHNLNEQLKILKKQKSAYKEKLSIAKEELEKQKAKLEAQGVEIGKDGNIKNYTETLKKKQEEVNSLVGKYNEATAEGQENLKGQVDAQKKNYDELKKQMGEYEQLNGQTIPEIEAQIAQIEEMIIELMIERFNAKIELHIDWQNFLNEYREFKNEVQEFMNTRATMFIDLATGEISGRNDIWANAQNLAQTRREAEKIARLQQQDAEDRYKENTKKLKSKKGRAKLAEEYGVTLTSKADRKAFQKQLAEEYEETLTGIQDSKKQLLEKAQQAYEQSVIPKDATQATLQNQLRQQFSEINKTAAAARAQANQDYIDNQAKYKKNKRDQSLSEFYNVDLNDKKVRRTFKQTMLDTYQDSLDSIEEARQESLNKAIQQYDDAMTQISNDGKIKVVDVFKTYTDSMNSLAEASDQMINGTLLKDGATGISILERSMKHADELAERIQRMNDNTKFDKLGDKIMGTDQLKVGNINPLTGERITNKKELKRVKKQIGKDKSGQVYADMQKKIYEDGQKYAQNLEEQIKTLQNQIEKAFETYYAAIDKVIDYTDAIIEDYEYINDLYELQIKMAKLLGEEEKDYAKLLRENQKDNRKRQFAYYKEQIKLMKNQMNLAIQREGVESESYKKFYEEYKKLVKEFYQLRLEEIENLEDEANEALDDIIEKFNKLVTINLGIDELGDRWSNMKDQADSYLDSVEKAFAIQSLRNKYLKAIDETDNIDQQNELRRIMEQQLKILQDAEYLSQAEVTNAENIFEITKKQMALEEAKQNKNKMRLRRDSQGNYTYQFVADQNDIKDKTQELQDALKKMNDDTTKALEENYDTQVDLFQNFISKLKDIKDSYIEGDLTEAEYAERLDAAYADFSKSYTIAQSQYGRLGVNYKDANTLSLFGLAGNSANIDALLKDMGISAELSEDIKSILESLASESGEFSLLKLLGNSNLADIIDSMVEGSSIVLGGINGMYDLFEAVPGDLLNDYEKTREEAENTINQLKEEGIAERNSIDDAKKSLLEEMSIDFADVEQTVNDNISTVNYLQEEGVDLLDNLWNTAQDILNENTAAMAEANEALKAILDALQAMAEESEYGSGTGSISKYERATFGHKDENGRLVQDTLTTGDISGLKSKNAKYIANINASPGQIVIMSKKADKNGRVKIGYYDETTGKTVTLGKVAIGSLVGYDTGGYTGDWTGNNGKLAMLHKKEMVLNQDDTSNILNAVQIARSIADAVQDLQSAAAGTSNFAQALFGGSNNGSILDQNVTIHATFPNVTNHSEIEEALMNLVNVASQKASPNRRAS